MSTNLPLDRLFEAAADVRVRAHAPYSGFFVGAAVLDREGRIHVGCNVENAALPEGLCAEAGAIAAMVAAGGREILAVAIVGGPAEGEPVLCPPCGGCRQKIREFAVDATTVHLRDDGGAVTSLTAAELLPLSFGPGHL
ncbi:cytidine deaminase [Pinisolibacter sp.]|uniref:cytidine deaminase n=1 Tax=Pinisolibacter sp. TaxID=2172024 RepID=UPI002FDC7D38